MKTDFLLQFKGLWWFEKQFAKLTAKAVAASQAGRQQLIKCVECGIAYTYLGGGRAQHTQLNSSPVAAGDRAHRL